MALYKLPVVLEPQPEGGYTITCPILPELITEADTLDEVSANVSDALAAVIEIYEDSGRQLPAVLQPVSADSPLLIETLIPVPVKLNTAKPLRNSASWAVRKLHGAAEGLTGSGSTRRQAKPAHCLTGAT